MAFVCARCDRVPHLSVQTCATRVRSTRQYGSLKFDTTNAFQANPFYRERASLPQQRGAMHFSVQILYQTSTIYHRDIELLAEAREMLPNMLHTNVNRPWKRVCVLMHVTVSAHDRSQSHPSDSDLMLKLYSKRHTIWLVLCSYIFVVNRCSVNSSGTLRRTGLNCLYILYLHYMCWWFCGSVYSVRKMVWQSIVSRHWLSNCLHAHFY